MPIELTETEIEVLGLFQKRFAKGRQTYGQGLSFKQSEDVEKWCQEALEEAADMVVYLMGLKLRLQDMKTQAAEIEKNIH
jgi:hypothetical protein